MQAYFVSFKKDRAYKNSSVWRTRQMWLMLSSNCVICGNKK